MSRPQRIEGFSYIGCYQYFLTTCTFERRETFRDHHVTTQTIEQFRTTSRSEGFEQRSGAAYALTSDEPLWQKGYYEHVLRQEEDAKDIARYIIANPVRAGIVESPDRYPYSGSDKWSIQELMEWVTTT